MDASRGPARAGRLAMLAGMAAESAGRRAAALPVGRPLVGFLAGGLVALALGVGLGGFDGPTAASAAVLCAVMALVAITGWDLLVRALPPGIRPIAIGAPDESGWGPARMLTRHVGPVALLAAGALLAHFLW